MSDTSDTLAPASLEIKQLDQVRYLTAYLDTHAEQLTEPGPPMLLVLAHTNAFTNDGAAIDGDILQALIAAQNEHFITVYPNPFVSDLLYQFDGSQFHRGLYVIRVTVDQTVHTKLVIKE